MARKRRLKGEGSIYYDDERGSYVALFDCGKDPKTGRRIRRKLRAASQRELQQRIADEKAKAGGSIRPRQKGSVGDFIATWLASVRENRAPNTYASYRYLMDAYVVPYIGARRLDEVEVDDIAHLYARLKNDGVSTAVREHVATRVRTLFALAVKQRRIPFNPAMLVDKPRHVRKESRYLDFDQAARFLIAARDDRLEAFFVLALTAGLRFGELAGLHWDDVDLEKGFIAVRHQLVEVAGALSLGALKTTTSRRPVELDPLAIDALRRRRKAYMAEGHGSPLIFTTPNGQPLRRSNVRRRSFEAIAKAAGLSGLTIHGLRHACGALMSSYGAKAVQERLGHSTAKLTLDRYADLLPSIQHSAVVGFHGELVAAMRRVQEKG